MILCESSLITILKSFLLPNSGLRLFSHPWIDVDDQGNAVDDSSQIGSSLLKLGYSANTTSALLTMGRINTTLAQRSQTMLQKYFSPHVQPVGLVGSSEFNLTLVNKMEPTSTKRDLKKEAAYGMGKISVGWHRDSGLKDFSTIAVYQTVKKGSSSWGSTSDDNCDGGWGVAVRAMDGGPLESVPALKVPLPPGSLYYMLDDFNHNHEHAVIAGVEGVRYSSTHRVAREGQGTWQYIRDKMQAFFVSAECFNLKEGAVVGLSSNISVRKINEKLVSHIRVQQSLLSEIEFEWLRQWYVQGQKVSFRHT